MRERSSHAQRAVIEAVEGRSLLSTVALFYNASYVDTVTTDGTPPSATNLKDELVGLGHTVKTFTGLDTTSLTAALTGADALVVPDLANGALIGVLSNAAKSVITNFVAGGGGYVGIGNKQERTMGTMSSLFSLPTYADGGLKNFDLAIRSGATGTQYAGGPSFVRDGGGAYTISTWAADVNVIKDIYTHESSGYWWRYSAVALFKYANRDSVAFLGSDWARGGPNGVGDTANWDIVLGRTIKQVARTAPAAPTAPSTLAASVVTSSQVKLTWKDNSSNETGFRVERSTSATFASGIVSTDVAANTMTTTLSGLTANTTYYFRLRAVNGSSLSAYSNTASITTPATTPTAPTLLTATVLSTSAISLSWKDNAATETGYSLQRATNAAFTTGLVTTSLAANATSTVVTGLAANTLYYFRVKAVSGSVSSTYSNTGSATTKAVFTLASGKLTVNGSSANDRVNLWMGGTSLIAKVNGVSQAYTASGVTSISILGSEGDDYIAVGTGIRGARLEGGGGNDTLIGGSNADSIFGQAGNDVLIGSGGADSLDGGDGDDFFYALDGAKDTINGGAGTDGLYGESTDVRSLVEDILA